MAKNHKIFIIGATGFVGKQTLKTLAQKENIELTCLVREESEGHFHTFCKKHNIEASHITGNIENKALMQKALKGQDGVIYVASLGFPYAENIVETLEKSGIKRAVFTSTTAIFTKLNAPSKKVRTAAEKRINESTLNWTILRPTMIYGQKGDRNMERLVRYINKYLILPVPGNGQCLQQPIHVTDVANAVVDSYFSNKTHKKSYNISGADALTFEQVAQTTAALLNKTLFIMKVPLKPCLWVLSAYEKLCTLIKRTPRLKAEQLLRLNENKDFSHQEASKDFGFAPITFKAGMAQLTESLKND